MHWRSARRYHKHTLCVANIVVCVSCARAEVPLDDERSACGCTTILFGGVRMQMPEKIFGNNWLELQHRERSLALCFDCAGALRRWAQLSLEMVDDRRSGRPAWTGWTCDAAELHGTWQQSSWGAITDYSRREEWDCEHPAPPACRPGAGEAGQAEAGRARCPSSAHAPLACAHCRALSSAAPAHLSGRRVLSHRL